MSSKLKLSTSCGFRFYLSSDAYSSLTEARDHLRLLAQLAESRGQGVDVIYLSAEALAQCFDRLAEDLDHIAQAVTQVS